MQPCARRWRGGAAGSGAWADGYASRLHVREERKAGHLQERLLRSIEGELLAGEVRERLVVIEVLKRRERRLVLLVAILVRGRQRIELAQARPDPGTYREHVVRGLVDVLQCLADAIRETRAIGRARDGHPEHVDEVLDRREHALRRA